MHDQALMQITQQAGNGVDGLLNSVFSFLQRRTDYFYEAEPGDKMGFPPKYSEQLIYRYYKHYQFEHEKKFPSKGEDLAKRWKEYEEKAYAAAAKKKAEDKAEAEAKKEAAAAAAEKAGEAVESKVEIV